MSEDRAPTFALPVSQEPVRVAARRLSWFRTAFRTVLERIEEETGTRFQIDERLLAQCFVSWLRKVERMKRPAGEGRRAFFEHAAGMMLSELIEVGPISVVALPAYADSQRPEIFWPEGFCYTVFCLNVAGGAIRQEFGADLVIGEEFSELRTWWSFRENIAADRGYSIAFFKLFAGSEPNWQMPHLFQWSAGETPIIGPIAGTH